MVRIFIYQTAVFDVQQYKKKNNLIEKKKHSIKYICVIFLLFRKIFPQFFCVKPSPGGLKYYFPKIIVDRLPFIPKSTATNELITCLRSATEFSRQQCLFSKILLICFDRYCSLLFCGFTFIEKERAKIRRLGLLQVWWCILSEYVDIDNHQRRTQRKGSSIRFEK